MNIIFRDVFPKTKKYSTYHFFILFLLFLILLFYGLFLLEKIDLSVADLGRHLKNGELIFSKNFDVIYKNFYSYTFGDYPFINHHWASGLVFFLIFKIGNFFGLHLFFIFLNLITFFLFFLLAQEEGGFKISALFSLFLIPLIASRKEVRPETFSYFFSALFFLILWGYKKNFISCRYLFVLPFLGMIWINMHIYFFLGPFLIGVFLLEEILQRNWAKIKELSFVLVLTILASLLNPFGLKAVFYPLNIFKDYGYKILENQSVLFLQKYGISSPNFVFFEISLFILFSSFVFLLFFDHRNFSLIYFLLGLTFGLMGWLAIRNFALFGFFALPIIAYNLKKIFAFLVLKDKIKCETTKINFIFASLFLLVFFIVFLVYKDLFFFGNNNHFGIGLAPAVDQSSNFFKKENIQGPILNNYDIGSYLIYYLYPTQKVFVDNRPEAYPSSFFKEIYIPLQENDLVWQEKDKLYNFNAIFFSHRDLTPWGQNFLIKRINDQNWAPVFADQYAIIFLKRNKINQDIIEKYEIPRDQFKIIKLR